MRRLILTVCWFVLWAATVQADTFYLKDGTVIKGWIEKADVATYTIKTNLGVVTIPREQIQRIDVQANADSLNANTVTNPGNINVNVPENLNVNMTQTDQRVGAGSSIMTIGGGALGVCAGLLVGGLILSNSDGNDNGDVLLVSGLIGLGVGAIIGWSASKPKRHSLLEVDRNFRLTLTQPDVHLTPLRKGVDVEMALLSASF